jgi:hypothetical protein
MAIFNSFLYVYQRVTTMAFIHFYTTHKRGDDLVVYGIYESYMAARANPTLIFLSPLKASRPQ